MPSTPPSAAARFAGRLNPMAVRLGVAIVAGALLAWVGVRAARRSAEVRAQLDRAEATLAGFRDLRARYEPAVAAESIAWRRSLLELQDLGIMGGERLTLTQQVARAAEVAGLEDVRVTISPPDTTGSETRLSTEGIQRKPASFALLVECRGGLRSVISFLGELPFSVAPTELDLRRADGRGRHRISLAVYELTFSNGPPALWSSVERGDPRRGGSDRPGG